MPKIKVLEKHWQIALPEAFGKLYRAFEYPMLSPCEFLSPDEMLADAECWRGMLPQFLPFGHDGGEDFYGFYVPPITAGPDYPVLAWNHEFDHYYPIASGFEAFLRWCLVTGRYEAQDSLEEEGLPYEAAEEQRAEFAHIVGLPQDLVSADLPRNERELHERVIASDPQAAHSLLMLGSHWFRRDDVERARDYFTRASEAAPWFADPYFLLAETYRASDREDLAIERWWQVLQCPIALSTRIATYDLGAEMPDEEIYQVAVDGLLGAAARLPQQISASPLFRLFASDDPYTSEARLDLAGELVNAGDLGGAERETLNALTLGTEDEEMDAAYDALIALYERANRHRDAELCRRDRSAA